MSEIKRLEQEQAWDRLFPLYRRKNDLLNMLRCAFALDDPSLIGQCVNTLLETQDCVITQDGSTLSASDILADFRETLEQDTSYDIFDFPLIPPGEFEVSLGDILHIKRSWDDKLDNRMTLNSLRAAHDKLRAHGFAGSQALHMIIMRVVNQEMISDDVAQQLIVDLFESFNDTSHQWPQFFAHALAFLLVGGSAIECLTPLMWMGIDIDQCFRETVTQGLRLADLRDGSVTLGRKSPEEDP